VVLPWSAQQLVSEVDEILDRARAQSSIQVQSDYAKYLVIRLGGLVEQVVTQIILTYVEGQASQPIVAHVSWRMGTFQNPNMERLLQLVGSFDRHRRDQLDAAITEPEREALGSVMAQRNRIAHGEQSTISLSQVADYYAEIKSMLTEIAARF
jgi:RiboL-PSP-HEPN